MRIGYWISDVCSSDLVDLRRGNRLAERERNLVVDFGDDDAGCVDRGARVIADQTEAVLAVLIGWRELHERDVTADQSLLDVRADLTDVAWNHLQLAGLGQRAQRADRAHARQREAGDGFRRQQRREA